MIARQPALNPGELPIHDLMLHGWIALFGSSLTAMRALSAALGVASILLVYLVVCELFEESALTRDDVRTVAGLSALVFAVNLVTIKYSHEARMYPLMLAAILAQVTIFLRTLRIGGLANYAAVVVADGDRDRLELRRAADSRDRKPLAHLYSRARWMAPRQCQGAKRAWVIAVALAAAD